MDSIQMVGERWKRLLHIADLLIMTLVVLSVASVFVTTFNLSPEVRKALFVFEGVCSLVFTIEYVARTAHARWKYVLSGMGLIDLLSILPFYLPMFFHGNLLVLRVFRLLRLLRLFKLNRYFDSLTALGAVLKEKSKELIASMFVVALMLIVSSLFIYTVEHDAQPEAFANAFSGLWWAVATLTTVGYGDIYPVTALGRVFGAFIALLGIGMVAIPTGIISSGLMEYMNRNKKTESDEALAYCPHCGKKL